MSVKPMKTPITAHLKVLTTNMLKRNKMSVSEVGVSNSTLRCKLSRRLCSDRRQHCMKKKRSTLIHFNDITVLTYQECQRRGLRQENVGSLELARLFSAMKCDVIQQCNVTAGQTHAFAHSWKMTL